MRSRRSRSLRGEDFRQTTDTPGMNGATLLEAAMSDEALLEFLRDIDDCPICASMLSEVDGGMRPRRSH